MGHNYFVYITTNPNHTTLYIGVTNDLRNRIFEHQENKGKRNSFAGCYYCYKLIYFEWFDHIEDAIAREKQLKGWKRDKKEQLIEIENPKWKSLNNTLESL
jgi:putative endonuclease